MADDDPVVLHSVASALAAAGFDVAAVPDSEHALEALDKQQPDVLLLDIDMPGTENLQLLSHVCEVMPFLPVMLLTGQPTVESAIQAVRLGVVDYLAKPSKVDDLIERLDLAVHRGRTLRSIETAMTLAQDLAARLCALSQVVRRAPGARLPLDSGHAREAQADPLRNLSQSEAHKLSPRERDVLRELAKGRSPQQMAVTLELSTNTIRNHLKSIFLKLGVNSQVALLGKLATPR